MIHGFHGGFAHFLAFPTTRRRLLGFDTCSLSVMLSETLIHVALNVGGVFENIPDYTLVDRPSKEIQLSDRCSVDGIFAANLEINPFTSAKRIEHLFRIGL